MVMDNIIYANESFLIQGALFEVYNTLGSGFLEAVYQEALELELKQRNIPFVSQKELTISYKGHELKQTYRADIVCYDKVILELKAVKTLLPEHSAQLHNYLCATGMKLGILVNFGSHSKIEIKRIVV
jgi:GxxExxY protein